MHKQADKAVEYKGLPPLALTKAQHDTTIFLNVKVVFKRTAGEYFWLRMRQNLVSLSLAMVLLSAQGNESAVSLLRFLVLMPKWLTLKVDLPHLVLSPLVPHLVCSI